MTKNKSKLNFRGFIVLVIFVLFAISAVYGAIAIARYGFNPFAWPVILPLPQSAFPQL